MSAKFEPIRIVDLVADKTEQSPTASGLRLMYLRLSHTPTDAWGQLFQGQRYLPTGRAIHSMAREARVEENYIVVDCVPEEMEKHLPELQHDVSVTNGEYQKYLRTLTAKAEQQRQKQKEERDRIEEVKSHLKFD